MGFDLMHPHTQSDPPRTGWVTAGTSDRTARTSSSPSCLLPAEHPEERPDRRLPGPTPPAIPEKRSTLQMGQISMVRCSSARSSGISRSRSMSQTRADSLSSVSMLVRSQLSWRSGFSVSRT